MRLDWLPEGELPPAGPAELATIVGMGKVGGIVL